MNKTQYEEMNDLLLVEKENKILEAKKLYKEQRKQHKDDKKEYKEKKRAYHEAKRKLKKECKEKRRYLKSEYRCIDYEKEVRIREKDMTEEQIRALREANGLPFYLRSEELFNMISHIVGGGAGVIFLIVGIICSCIYKPGNLTCLLSMIVFGITMSTLYAISAIYHGLHIGKGKRVLQVLDHCTIYVMIAGTYTPAVLLGLSSLAPWHYVFLSCIYVLSILGVVLNATMMRKKAVKVISMILYIAVGWGIIFFYPVLLKSIGIAGMWLMIGGGISYTVGSILYGIGSKRRYFHSVFHLFVNIGTLLQYLGILLYAVIA